MKKSFFLVLAFVAFAFASYGQTNQPEHPGPEIRPNYPNGFHLGLNMQGNVSQRVKVTPSVNVSDPSIKSSPRFGYNFGLEASYHFANYFGVSVGVDFESKSSVTIQKKDNNGYTDLVDFGDRSFSIPVRFEFHYPFKESNFSLYTALGLCIANIYDYTNYCGIYGEVEGVQLNFGDNDDNKPNVSMQLRLGTYYRLPYNDLLRLSITSNLAFKDRLQGSYSYRYESGKLSYRNNYLGLELSYIHCFRTKEQKEARSR